MENEFVMTGAATTPNPIGFIFYVFVHFTRLDSKVYVTFFGLTRLDKTNFKNSTGLFVFLTFAVY